MRTSLAIIAATGLWFSSAAAFGQTPAAPMADPAAPANVALKSPNDVGTGPLARGKTSFTMGEARARITQAGYSDVSQLAKNSDGLWQGLATRNGQKVSVSMDYKGDVASQ